MTEADTPPPLQGRVAVITGGARGQGRSHALELARLGADVAICDLCEDIATIGYPLSTRDDLAETAKLVDAAGRRCVSEVVDVRDLAAVIAFVDEAQASLGSVDIMVANAGVTAIGSVCDMTAFQWGDVIDINLTGVFNAIRAAAPHMRKQRSGRIVGISSMMGRTAQPAIPAYSASKWGVIGLCKSAAYELAGFGVTVNVIAPGNVSTPMIHNDQLYRLMRPDLEHATADEVAPVMAELHTQPLPWLEPEEITAALVYLVSDGARHVTGSVLDVNAGASARFTA
ncbi:MAG TPA: mycofactocin-coupled SDR family oxidoreductase [Acidimicrobiales bacterium]|nr:mycofactocin-coupled SDR family oxidoreductase [Acidimicrobiales bacterium]